MGLNQDDTSLAQRGFRAFEVPKTLHPATVIQRTFRIIGTVGTILDIGKLDAAPPRNPLLRPGRLIKRYANSDS